MNQRVKDIAVRIKGLRLLAGYEEETVASRLGNHRGVSPEV